MVVASLTEPAWCCSPVPWAALGSPLISFSLSFSSCPFLARQLTLAIPIIAALPFFFVMSCLLQTSFTDPGILPRATVCEAAALEKQIGEAPAPAAAGSPSSTFLDLRGVRIFSSHAVLGTLC